MAVKLLIDAGVAVQHTSILLLCDNPFSDYVESALRACGAVVSTATSPADLADKPAVDAVLVSLTPAEAPRLSREHLVVLAARMPGVVLVQFFGDVDQKAADELGIDVWPDPAPPHGHMGVLPSDIGPEPVVRLQAGGLKVGQVLLLPEADRTASDVAFLDVR